MKINKFFLTLLFFLFFFNCKQKDNIDIKLYENICEKVEKCDKNFNKFMDIKNHCLNFFKKIHEKKFESLPKIIECMQNTPCEEFSFQECTIPYIEELQNMKPAK